MGVAQGADFRHISIHALLAESDKPIPRIAKSIFNFYPRSPCGERPSSCSSSFSRSYFYPRSPCGERRRLRQTFNVKRIISIHALLAESDPDDTDNAAREEEFLSTLSLRRATNVVLLPEPFFPNFYPRSPCGERRILLLKLSILTKFLSTLSLRRATKSQSSRTGVRKYFYPRSPCGERPAELTTLVNKLFISIHALLAESD